MSYFNIVNNDKNNGGSSMAINSVIASALSFKNTSILSWNFVTSSEVRFGESFQRNSIELKVRPYKKIRCRCPKCMKVCPVYDHKAKEESSWRANDINGVPVVLLYKPVRIQCPIHGVLNEYLPWRDGTSRFTADFNNEVAFLALTSPKTVVCQYFGINWRTVGNCIQAAHERIEPDVTGRLRGLRKICVDETSYQTGHKYITVVYDIDRNRVAWLHPGHGTEIFEKFCELLTEEEQLAMEVVAGDGAKWIDTCTKKYFKNATRCIDFFHCVSWANEVLDKIRNSTRSKAERDVEEIRKEFKETEKAEREARKKIEDEIDRASAELRKLPVRGRPSKRREELKAYIISLESQINEFSKDKPVTEKEYEEAKRELESFPIRGRRSKRKAELLEIIALYEKNSGTSKSLSDAHKEIIEELKKKAEDIKGSKYALGMNPEHLNDNLRDKLKLVENTYPDLYTAYQYKESLRIILHMKDVVQAEFELDKWIADTATHNSPHMIKLSEKIKRHRDNILNSIKLQINSAKSEATNTTIKSLIKTARGFRNLSNMFSLIYLRCSDLVVPLNNRYQPSAEKQKELREIANARKNKREEEKRNSLTN